MGLTLITSLPLIVAMLLAFEDGDMTGIGSCGSPECIDQWVVALSLRRGCSKKHFICSGCPLNHYAFAYAFCICMEYCIWFFCQMREAQKSLELHGVKSIILIWLIVNVQMWLGGRVNFWLQICKWSVIVHACQNCLDYGRVGRCKHSIVLGEVKCFSDHRMIVYWRGCSVGLRWPPAMPYTSIYLALHRFAF